MGRRRPLGHGRTTKPRVDEVEFLGRQLEALAAAACDDEVAETAGKQVRRRALLKPRIGFADDLEYEADIVAFYGHAEVGGTVCDVGERLRTGETVRLISCAITSNRARYSGEREAEPGTPRGCA